MSPNQGGFITIAAAPGQSPKIHKNLYQKLPLAPDRIDGVGLQQLRPLSQWLDGAQAAGDDRRQRQYHLRAQHRAFAGRASMPGSRKFRMWRPPPRCRREFTRSSRPASPSSTTRFPMCGTEWQFGGDQNGNHGKYFLVSGNMIDNFAGDGIDHYGSHVRIENNHITNGHDICDNKCIHTDGIQGWNFNNRPGLLNTDVVINNNEIVVQTDPNLVLPADSFKASRSSTAIGTVFGSLTMSLSPTRSMALLCMARATSRSSTIRLSRQIRSAIPGSRIPGQGCSAGTAEQRDHSKQYRGRCFHQQERLGAGTSAGP